MTNPNPPTPRRRCRECDGWLLGRGEPSDYDPGDTELCWECDLAAYGEPE